MLPDFVVGTAFDMEKDYSLNSPSKSAAPAPPIPTGCKEVLVVTLAENGKLLEEVKEIVDCPRITSKAPAAEIITISCSPSPIKDLVREETVTMEERGSNSADKMLPLDLTIPKSESSSPREVTEALNSQSQMPQLSDVTQPSASMNIQDVLYLKVDDLEKKMAHVMESNSLLEKEKQLMEEKLRSTREQFLQANRVLTEGHQRTITDQFLSLAETTLACDRSTQKTEKEVLILKEFLHEKLTELKMDISNHVVVCLKEVEKLKTDFTHCTEQTLCKMENLEASQSKLRGDIAALLEKLNIPKEVKPVEMETRRPSRKRKRISTTNVEPIKVPVKFTTPGPLATISSNSEIEASVDTTDDSSDGEVSRGRDTTGQFQPTSDDDSSDDEGSRKSDSLSHAKPTKVSEGSPLRRISKRTRVPSGRA